MAAAPAPQLQAVSWNVNKARLQHALSVLPRCDLAFLQEALVPQADFLEQYGVHCYFPPRLPRRGRPCIAVRGSLAEVVDAVRVDENFAGVSWPLGDSRVAAVSVYFPDAGKADAVWEEAAARLSAWWAELRAACRGELLLLAAGDLNVEFGAAAVGGPVGPNVWRRGAPLTPRSVTASAWLREWGLRAENTWQGMGWTRRPWREGGRKTEIDFVLNGAGVAADSWHKDDPSWCPTIGSDHCLLRWRWSAGGPAPLSVPAARPRKVPVCPRLADSPAAVVAWARAVSDEALAAPTGGVDLDVWPRAFAKAGAELLCSRPAAPSAHRCCPYLPRAAGLVEALASERRPAERRSLLRRLRRVRAAAAEQPARASALLGGAVARRWAQAAARWPLASPGVACRCPAEVLDLADKRVQNTWAKEAPRSELRRLTAVMAEAWRDHGDRPIRAPSKDAWWEAWRRLLQRPDGADDAVSVRALGLLPPAARQRLQEDLEGWWLSVVEPPPPSWREQALTWIGKPRRQPLVSNLRPLIQEPVPMKLLSHALTQEFSEELRPRALWCHGFVRGARAESMIMAARLLTAKAAEWCDEVWVIKADVADAFGSMPRPLLARCLSRRLGAEAATSWMRLLTGWRTTARWRGIPGRPLRWTRGQRQGAVSTPSLWAALLDDVLGPVVERWVAEGRGWLLPVAAGWPEGWSQPGRRRGTGDPDLHERLSHAVFADDILIFARSAAEAAAMLEELEAALVAAGLALADDKVELWCGGAAGVTLATSRRVVTSAVELDVLGWLLSPTPGADQRAAEQRAWKALLAARATLLTRRLSRTARLQRFVSAVLPVLLWGACAWNWGAGALRECAAVVRRMVRRVAALPPVAGDGPQRRRREAYAADACLEPLLGAPLQVWLLTRALQPVQALVRGRPESLLCRLMAWRSVADWHRWAELVRLLRLGSEPWRRRRIGRPPRRWEAALIDCLGEEWWTYSTVSLKCAAWDLARSWQSPVG